LEFVLYNNTKNQSDIMKATR